MQMVEMLMHSVLYDKLVFVGKSSNYKAAFESKDMEMDGTMVAF